MQVLVLYKRNAIFDNESDIYIIVIVETGLLRCEIVKIEFEKREIYALSDKTIRNGFWLGRGHALTLNVYDRIERDIKRITYIFWRENTYL